MDDTASPSFASSDSTNRETPGSESAPLPSSRLTFNGDGTEFFRIWIVNLTLTLLTLGIYSAWAKVRTNRYFYGSTALEGDTFEYHAQPMQILKGRIIAIGALIVYVLAQTFFPVVSIVLVGLFLLALPVIVVRSLRFNAIMSSWRGIRFGFDGSAWEAAKVYLFWPLFGIVTLGFGMPYVWYKQNQYTVGGHRFGTTQAQSTTKSGDFYAIFFILMGIVVGASILLGILGIFVAVGVGLGADEGEGGVAALVIAGLIWVGYFLMYVLAFAVFQAMRYRLVYSNISLADTSTHSDVVTAEWVKIVLVNSVLLVLTLGIYYPWARVRLTHYMVSHTSIESADLSSFIARTGQDETALGEELGEAFDLGIGV